MDLITKYHRGAHDNLEDDTQQRSFTKSIKNLSKVVQLEESLSHFSIYAHVELHVFEVIVNCVLLHRNLPFRINSKNNRLLAVRFINKLNSRLKLGMLVLQPIYGILKFKAVLLPPEDMSNETKLQKAMLCCCEKFQATLLHLNALLKLLDDEVSNDQSFARIKYCLQNYTAYPKLQNIKVSDSPAALLNLENNNDASASSVDIIKKLQSYLVQPEFESGRTNDKPNIYTEFIINRCSEVNWTEIYSTLSSTIWAASVQYTYKDSHYQDPLRKLIVKKEAKPLNQSKVEHEKKILSTVESAKNPYMAKFYHSEQPQVAHCIFGDYYKYSSSDTYLRQTAEYTTLCTKLRLLYSAAMGLSFLHKNGIFHLDFKPKNLLVSSILITRVNDLGQSYSAKVCRPGYVPGYTLPYSPPEAFRDKLVLTDKYDVFSLGFTILEVIFQVNPADIFNSHTNFKEHVQDLTYLDRMFRVCQEKFMEFGPRCVMASLLCLCKQCLSADLDERPDLSWGIAILRESLEFVVYNF